MFTSMCAMGRKSSMVAGRESGLGASRMGYSGRPDGIIVDCARIRSPRREGGAAVSRPAAIDPRDGPERTARVDEISLPKHHSCLRHPAFPLAENDGMRRL